MNIAIIGRTETLYDTALLLHEKGHNIRLILTAKAADEYTRTAEDFERLAAEIGAEYIYSANINKEENIQRLKALQLDIGVSMNYINVISQLAIDQLKLGILNAHGGDLPRFRGNACHAWAILNNEERIGLCIHKMIGGELDSGDIIARDYLPLTIDTKVTDAVNWMHHKIPELYGVALDRLSEDESYVLEVQSKDPAKSLRCYPRKPEDGRIDWNWSNHRVIRQINACNRPYYGAFCDYEGDELKIWEAELLEDGEVYLAVPGQVASINKQDGTIDVICGDGKIRIKEIELHGQVDVPTNQIKSIRKRLT